MSDGEKMAEIYSSKILNIDLTDAKLEKDKKWFNQASVDTVKSANADLITIQSLLPANSTQDFIYLFGPSYESFTNYGLGNGQPTTVILYRKDKFKAKQVDVKALAGTGGSFLKDHTSITMAHVWSLGRENKASLSLISWAPEAKNKGTKEKRRINLLEGLIKFLGMFRKTANIKMRFVVCGHFGGDVRTANFNRFPYFKHFNLVRPNHVRYMLFTSPFIFTEDVLHAMEMPVPNVFPQMSNKNLKMICVSGFNSDEIYVTNQFDNLPKTVNYSFDGTSDMKPGQNEEEQKLKMMEKVVEAFHFTSLRKQVREDKAFKRAVERNRNRPLITKTLHDEEELEIFPQYNPKKAKKLVKNRSNISNLTYIPDNKPVKDKTKLHPIATSASNNMLDSLESSKFPPIVDGMDVDTKVALQKEFMMNYLHRKNTPVHQVNQVPIDQNVTNFALSYNNPLPSAVMTVPSTPNGDFRRRATDLSPRHKPKEKHALF